MSDNRAELIGTDWRQPDLWHDTPEEALRAAVDASGGPKRVAMRLWPAKTLAEAQRHLLHCLDRERREKVSLAELDRLGQWARDAGCHVLIAYFAKSWGYRVPEPEDLEDEELRLRAAYVQAVRVQSELVKRLELLGRNRSERDLREVG